MNQEILIEIFKKVSLFDLSEAQFETFNDLEDHWTINATNGDRVYDAMKYDGNLFWMMNNNGTFDLLNPMIDAFEILIPHKQHEEYQQQLTESLYCPACQAIDEHDCFCGEEDTFCSLRGEANDRHHKGCPYYIDLFEY